ncbi:LysR substrate-binding domain-containing protein [Marinomonas aquiplantarum]|uniref:LysR family glycine cleavage system transcriptional activator n=1 Tax=Marinomonas aquiplantarum TaxID=491951 RepID=A0A366CVT6_9GAMM|nr:LysR substrate-binding domain-containing protein [Marinomonas aquiplantarum]RBO81951.1 LysR family glycine cleavage system transcriptional activator [Marinomonas aquiplantarum]
MLPRRKLPALNSLRAFEVAGRCLSFRRAAEELGVTQGAVAQQVRSLEEHLGVLLFQRLPRGLALTPKGIVYLASLTRAFDVMGEATSIMVERSNTVTISVTPTFAAKLLIPRLGSLNTRFPDIELKTVATESISDFDADQIDIAVRLSKEPFASNLQAEPLFPQELVVVASPQLLEGQSVPLSLEMLQQFPLLHDAHNHWPTILRSNEKIAGAKFNQTSLAIDAALAGQGVALVCRAFVAQELAFGRLVQLLDHSFFIKPDYFLVKKKDIQTSVAVSAVWQWCLDEFELK